MGTLAAGAGAVPVAEQLLVAGPALLAADLPLPPPEEPTGVALAGSVTATPVDGGWTLTGTATDVSWSGVVRHLVVLATGPDAPVLALVAADGLPAGEARNLAGEPRGSVVLGGAPARVAPVTEAQVAEVRARFALARAVQLAAALEQVLAWTVQYAGERHQFGRPLARFQAIQMELAQMAGEVTAATAL
ncbi:acyl-CoA dehydrogenase family protein, partial [Geodermatophilus sp. CPCC 205506]|uniref:acyl-CoA dehydrogenase family protein n=1 Tax=Geodermatophilus sp. CPCC 205506 TaxID=2936596 RepID=UPI003F52AC6C